VDSVDLTLGLAPLPDDAGHTLVRMKDVWLWRVHLVGDLLAQFVKLGARPYRRGAA
jgi:hypothetical protein